MPIVRGVLAVIVGFVVMFIIQAIGLTIGYFVVPMDKIYEGDTLHTSLLWTIIMLATGLIASIIGGMIGAVIGKSPRHLPVKILAVIVLLLGMASGYRQVQEIKSRTPEELHRTGSEKVWEAAKVSAPPTWYSYTIPVVSAAGFLIGAAVIKKRSYDEYYEPTAAA